MTRSDGAAASALEMINRCFRQQNPDAFGGEQVPEGIVPHELRYGGGSDPVSTAPVMAEEPLGAPDAVRLDAPLIVIAETFP